MGRARAGISGRRTALAVGALSFVTQVGCAGEFDVHRKEVLALGELTAAPAVMDAPGYSREGNLKAIYFDALPWMGKPTKVFAWMGLPENREGKGKVPGVVLVHGGGGTAFKEWVTRWNARGFAAISIAVEGQTDERLPKESGEKHSPWKSHEWPGPKRAGIYGDSDQPMKDQWMYHAVADTILANSLLRSLPEVDADQVGLMGVSWGGVIASTVVGIDDRFAFAIPTYGCGHMSDAGNQYGKALGDNALYKEVWDPVLRLGEATMPTLWFSWPEDKHFPLDCQAASYRAVKGPWMVSLVPGMGHGHGPPWGRPEGYAFAEAIVETGKPWCRQTDSAVTAGQCSVSFVSEKGFDNAVLVSTADQGLTGNRRWVESPAALTRKGDEWLVTAKLPEDTTAWFINVHSGDLTVSSSYEEVQAGTSAGGRDLQNAVPDTMWTYKRVDGKDLEMSVFLPADYEKNEGKGFPAIVIFHGGSWNAGEASWHYPDCAYWSGRGMIAVSVDYRLKDRDGVEVPLECVKDAKSAIRYLRKNARELKVDPGRVVAAGGSAGGQLAAALATITAPETNDDVYDVAIPCRPDAVILYNPYFKCAPELSPPNHIAEGLPPFITFIGDEDPAITVESLVSFHGALKEAGASSELYVGKGGKHGFCNGRNKDNPFFYWSLELEDRFLVKHGMLKGRSIISVPNGVAGFDEVDFEAFN